MKRPKSIPLSDLRVTLNSTSSKRTRNAILKETAAQEKDDDSRRSKTFDTSTLSYGYGWNRAHPYDRPYSVTNICVQEYILPNSRSLCDLYEQDRSYVCEDGHAVIWRKKMNLKKLAMRKALKSFMNRLNTGLAMTLDNYEPHPDKQEEWEHFKEDAKQSFSDSLNQVFRQFMQ